MTKRISLILFFLLFVVVCNATADSTYTLSNDTLRIDERQVDKPLLETYKADSEFQYGRPQQGVSPWQRFLIWVLSILGKFLLFATQTVVGKILFYTILSAILLWVILKLLNIDVKDLFYKGNASSKIDFKIADENIHELDFQKLIDSAVQKKEYRDAVRLTFLYALKKLSEANAIKWLPGKTNDDYLKEIKQHAALPRLQELRYYFDYAWYGQFEITEKTYQEVRQSFQELNAKLK